MLLCTDDEVEEKVTWFLKGLAEFYNMTEKTFEQKWRLCREKA